MKIVGGMTYLKEQANRRIINVPKFIDVMLTELDRFEEADSKKRNLIISGKSSTETSFSANELATDIDKMMKQIERPEIEEIEEGITANALQYEMQNMEKSVKSGINQMKLEYTRDVMDIMTNLRKEWGMTYPEEEK